MQTYITGLGIVSAIGNNVKENVDSLKNKKPGISDITLFDTAHNVPVAEVKLTNNELVDLLDLPKDKVFSRTILLGMMAVQEAISDACVDTNDNLRIGLISSTSAGGMALSEKFYSEFYHNNNAVHL